MTIRPLNARISNIGLDANALDRNGTDRDHLVDRFCKLASGGTLTVVVAGGVRGEVQHPRTPADVQASVLPRIFNLRPGLNTFQQTERARVLAVLRGNARPGKHVADASHLSEAVETGCSYFITEDKRILDKRRELASVLPPSLTISTLREFFEIFNRYETERPR